ncbi:hypothetical protein LX36DRAFT_398490 [Colletotrichum falcatum]|nr:hypothetical protein LX36DRAFT_398490 [Colletotrichum falcatum]
MYAGGHAQVFALCLIMALLRLRHSPPPHGLCLRATTRWPWPWPEMAAAAGGGGIHQDWRAGILMPTNPAMEDHGPLSATGNAFRQHRRDGEGHGSWSSLVYSHAFPMSTKPVIWGGGQRTCCVRRGPQQHLTRRTPKPRRLESGRSNLPVPRCEASRVKGIDPPCPDSSQFSTNRAWSGQEKDRQARPNEQQQQQQQPPSSLACRIPSPLRPRCAENQTECGEGGGKRCCRPLDEIFGDFAPGKQTGQSNE